MKIKVVVTLKNGVLDPQGKAIQQTLNGMSFSNVDDVRQGKFFEINVNEQDESKAINQVEEFKKITPITGIIMTKLDGTAKGGILLAIGKKFKLPIIALGMGEKEDDLQTFNSEYFANALMHF